MGIVVRKLEKWFGKLKVVDDVSFQVQTGELVALLGPSGGGKSTVLRIIAGLETPDAGSVELFGVDATHKRVQERTVGFVFQHYALFRHMTVRQNIAFGLEVRKTPKAEVNATVDELLALVQLQGLGERYPAQLSGGQRQRVALARALAPKPQLLLLDEPFGALDAKVRLELREWIRKLHHERGITSVFVTHDQDEAMDLADRVVVLNKGRIEQTGSPEEIYDRPATEFVASFVGSINVLRGSVSGGHANLGALAVKAPDGANDGRAVRAFVRPHDVHIEASHGRGSEPSVPDEAKAPDASADGDEAPLSPKPPRPAASRDVATARVERISRVGYMVKLELRLGDDQALAVEVTKERAAELGLAEGDKVRVNLREAKIFVQDYSI